MPLWTWMPLLASLSLRVWPTKAKPGEVLTLRIFAPQEVKAVKGSFQGREIIFVAKGEGEFSALLGVSRKAQPGEEKIYVEAFLSEGRVVGNTASVRILPRKFRVQRLRLPRGKRPLLSESLLRADYQKLEEATEELHPEPFWKGAFLMPVRGRITTGYGWRRLVGSSPRGQHSGWDMASPIGTPVKAPNDGIVKFAGELHVHGRTVVIDHGAGVVSYLLHLDRVMVRPGQKVRKGQVVGTVGSTGLATAPHLHWSIHVQGTAVDPALAVRGAIPQP